MKPDIESESRFLTTPRAFDAPARGGGFHQNIATTFGTEKNRMVWLPEGEKKLKIYLFILTDNVRT